MPLWLTTGDPRRVPLLKYWKVVPEGNVLADVLISVLKLIVDGEHTNGGVFNTRTGVWLTVICMEAGQNRPRVIVCIPGPAVAGLK